MARAHTIFSQTACILGVSQLGQSAQYLEDEIHDAEDTTSKSMHEPIKPTQKMIDDHEVSHLPFRAWCSSCVRGRAKIHPHRSIPNSEKEAELLPTVSYDYGFFGSKNDLGESGLLPV